MTGLEALAGPAGPASLQIWRLDLDREPGADRDPAQKDGEEIDALPALSEAEEGRAARFARTRDAARYRRQRRVLRAVLGRVSGRDGAGIELREEAFGRPAAVGLGSLDFNLSRSEGTGWIALCGQGRIGIDGECLRPLPELGRLAESQLSAGEFAAWETLPEAERLPAFLRAWSRKEAVLKVLGCGLGVEAALIEVGAGTPGTGFEPLSRIGAGLLEAGADVWPPAVVDPQGQGHRFDDWPTTLARLQVASLVGSEEAVAVAWLGARP